MCIITNQDNIVISVSLIPGLGTMPSDWNCYFPAKCPEGIPAEGDIYTE
jgi:hypothetical protein